MNVRRLKLRLLRHGPVALVLAAFASWLCRAHGGRLALATLGAFGVTWAAIPPLGRFLRRRRIVVRPGGRSAHRGSIPPMGGLAVFIPFAGVAVLLAASGGTQMLGLLIGATLMLAVGLVDDLRGAGPAVKIAAQVVAGLVLVWAGFRLDALDIPGWRTIDLGPAAIPLTLFWVVLATNAFNLIDGMDGIAAGVALVCLAGLVYLGVAAALAAIVMGALCGFLAHNLPRARIFLGDSGTMFLGFLLAGLLLMLPVRGNFPLALGLYAYPLGDLALAVLRRFVRGKPVFRGDRSHVHHKLRVHLGGDRRAVLLVWVLSTIAAALAISMRNLKFVVLLGMLWGGMAVLLVLLGRVRLRRMFVSRQPFQELHLVRQYVAGRIRIARNRDQVRIALERFVEDLPLASVSVGGLDISAGVTGRGRLESEVVRMRRGRATWAWRMNGVEEAALVNERRAVVAEVLTLAAGRLESIDGAGNGTGP